jgi:FAD:protein FMN transferase
MKNVVYRNMFSMGTRFELVMPGIDDELGDNIFAQVKSVVEQLESKISIYREDSIFSRLNRHTTTTPYQVGADTIELISQLKTESAKTFGYFDFTIKSLEKQSKESIDDLRARSISGLGADKVMIDFQQNTIAFQNKNILIDSGGFGKGLALDMVNDILNKNGLHSAFLNFGGSSVLGLGQHPFGDCWKTGICNIFNEQEQIYGLELKDSFMSVSGNTPGNLAKHESGHIINPMSGEPVQGFFQSVVWGNSGLQTEIVSTALACAPKDTRDLIMKNFPGFKALYITYNHQQKPEITYTHH